MTKIEMQKKLYAMQNSFSVENLNVFYVAQKVMR